MTEEQKKIVVDTGKLFFRDIIISNHIKNIEKLRLKDFKINPFIINYLASLFCGDTKPESLAKALLYPRILGTSINTSFGTSIQHFISGLAEVTGNASGIEGIDIEFIDALDGRRKFCQCKAGPQTINAPDVETIFGHFKKFIGKSRLDKLPLQIEDLIVGVLYGEEEELSSCYKTINSMYPVYCGATFWEHLTGDSRFYARLAKAFGEVVEDEKIDGRGIIQSKVNDLAKEIIANGGI